MADLTVSSAVDTFMQAANQATMLAALNITLGGAFATSGSFSTTLTVTGNTNVTLPTSGTLAVLGANTFTALQTITQASANAGILASTGYSLMGSNATSMIDLAGTLNTMGAPSVFRMSLTNTASDAATNFFHFLGGAAGATSLCYLRIDGAMRLLKSYSATNYHIGDATGGLSFSSGGSFFCISGAAIGAITASDGFSLRNIAKMGFTSGAADASSPDAFFMRKAAATIQMGADAAGVTDQMFTAASRITSDGVGANLTIAGGNGRGGAGGSLILATYDTQGAGTIGVLQSRLTIDTTGLVAITGRQTITGGTVTASTPLISTSQTWNAGGVTFIGEDHAFTKTAAATGSLMARWSTASRGSISFDEAGEILIGSPTGSVGTRSGNGPAVAGPTGSSLHVGCVNGNVYLGSIGTFGADVLISGNGKLSMRSSLSLGWSATNVSYDTLDAFFMRKAAATIQMGTDAAGVTNQMFTAASRITSNGAGANLTIAAGNCRGTTGEGGVGGSLILSTYAASATSNTIGTLTTRITITTTGAIILAALPTSDPGVSGQLYTSAGVVMQSA